MKPIGEEGGIASLRVLLAAAALASLLALMSCSPDVRVPQPPSSESAGSDEFFYRETPFALRVESVPRVVARPNYEWRGGYWTRYDDRWNWSDAQWAPGTQPYRGWDYGQGYSRMPGLWR